MKFFTKEFWSKKELSYQCVHLTISFWSGYLLFKIVEVLTHRYYGILLGVGILIGLLVELDQHNDKTWEEFKESSMEDCVRNLLFWTLGSILLLVIREYPLF